MHAREVSYDEQRHITRRFLAQLLEDEEDWGEAAMVCATTVIAFRFGSARASSNRR